MKCRLLPLFGLSVVCGCVTLPFRDTVEVRHEVGPTGPVDEKEIASFFAKSPEAEFPTKFAVVEFGTGEFERLVSKDYPALADGKDPLAPEGLVAAVMPFTGSSLLGSNYAEENLRLKAARAQADLLLLVDFRTRESRTWTALGLLDITLIGAVAIPSRACRLEALGRGTVIDVRTGLVLGIAETRVRGPGHFRPVAWCDSAVERDRDAVREQVYRQLAEQVIAQVRWTREQPRKGK